MNTLSDLAKDPLWPLWEHSFEGIALASPASWRVGVANPTLTNRLGRPAEALRGLPLDELFSENSRPSIRERVEQVWRGEAASAELTAQLQNDRLGGSVEIRLCRVVFGGESLVAMILRSATEPSPDSDPGNTERRDPLTELPDRQFLLSRLAMLLHGDRGADRQFAVLFVDLDNFKQVNDAHGHLIGDRVLREVGQRLMGCVREGDHVVRYGGDEFVVLVEHVAEQSEIDPVISRIEDALSNPIAIPEGEFALSVSIGVAAASPEYQSPEDLLRDADRAMYAAKRVRA